MRSALTGPSLGHLCLLLERECEIVLQQPFTVQWIHCLAFMFRIHGHLKNWPIDERLSQNQGSPNVFVAVVWSGLCVSKSCHCSHGTMVQWDPSLFEKSS